MNKAELIRQTKEKYPSYTNRQIAGVIDVKQGYAAHILWKAKHTKKKEIEKLEEETRKLRYVIKFLREN